MSGRTFTRTFAVFSALAALALTTACDGGIQLRGRVYEQRRPGSQSRAFIDRTPDDDLSGLTPLAGAKVTLYHGRDQDKANLDPSKGFTREVVTDASGEFDASAVTAPYKFKAALVVEKPGYKPVTEIFQHGESAHTVVVILVPDTQP
ncbi:MAG TPA: carboxypeptidase-like regulatory domain-containing protein [Pyrinomonadaceae bacterium]